MNTTFDGSMQQVRTAAVARIASIDNEAEGLRNYVAASEDLLRRLQPKPAERPVRTKQIRGPYFSGKNALEMAIQICESQPDRLFTRVEIVSEMERRGVTVTATRRLRLATCMRQSGRLDVFGSHAQTTYKAKRGQTP